MVLGDDSPRLPDPEGSELSALAVSTPREKKEPPYPSIIGSKSRCLRAMLSFSVPRTNCPKAVTTIGAYSMRTRYVRVQLLARRPRPGCRPFVAARPVPPATAPAAEVFRLAAAFA